MSLVSDSIIHLTSDILWSPCVALETPTAPDAEQPHPGMFAISRNTVVCYYIWSMAIFMGKRLGR